MAAGGWALLAVACAHLLTTPGAETSTDLIETLFVAQRLVTLQTLDLSSTPQARVPEVPWALGRPDRPVRSRHLPGVALSLAPLVWLDQAMGWNQPGRLGPFTRLQGHLFVWVALALLGFTLREHRASPQAIAAAITLTGMSWPVWKASCAPGPEPILIAWVALYLWAATSSRAPRRSVATRAVILVLLPWFHATGTLLGAGLVIAEGSALLDPPRSSRSFLTIVAAAGFGVGSMLIFWNWLYHGDLWMGGYALDPARGVFGGLSPTRGIALHVRTSARDASGMCVVLLWAALRRVPMARRPMLFAAALAAVLVGAFLTFSPPEPSRRLAPLWPALGLLIGLVWNSMRWIRPVPQAIVALNALGAFTAFMEKLGRHYQGPGGLFYPNVLWVRWALEGHAWTSLAAVLATMALGLVASAMVWSLLNGSAGGSD